MRENKGGGPKGVCLCSSAFCEFSCQPNFRSNRQRREQDATYNSGHAGTSSAFLPVLFLKFPQRDSPSSAKSAPVSPTLTRHTCVTVLLSRVFHSLLPVKIKARYVVGGISMAVDLHKYYFRYIVRIFGYIYVFFVFPEIKTA